MNRWIKLFLAFFSCAVILLVIAISSITGVSTPVGIEAQEPPPLVSTGSAPMTLIDVDPVRAAVQVLTLLDKAAPTPSARPLDPYSDCCKEVDWLQRENYRLRRRNEWIMSQLELANPAVVDTPLARWLLTLNENERPTMAVVDEMKECLEAFPVELTRHEGLWLVDRIQAWDWNAWGASPSEALITFLGEDRIRRELPFRAFSDHPENWVEEWMFR